MSGKFVELNRLELHSPRLRLYYQYKADRLPCTTLTIYALLHVADTIEVLGPVSQGAKSCILNGKMV